MSPSENESFEGEERVAELPMPAEREWLLDELRKVTDWTETGEYQIAEVWAPVASRMKSSPRRG